MEATPVYEPEPPARRKMAPWLVILLIVLGGCVALILISVCVIAALALLGLQIGNTFENIILNI